MRFDEVQTGETFTLVGDAPAPWRVVLRKVSADRAQDDQGGSIVVGAEEPVQVVGGNTLTHALWVEHDGEWRLVLRWQPAREARPRWASLAGGKAVGVSRPGGRLTGSPDEGDRRARALLAGALQARGELREAVTIYDELVADAPEAPILNNRGAARAALGDTTGAISDYTEALALDPTLAQAWSNRGNALSKLGRHEEALADYDQAMALASGADAAAIRCNRGLARKLGGDVEGSLVDFDAALALDPRFGPAYLARGSVRATRGDLRGAIADLERFLAVAPGAPQISQVRAAVARLRELEEREVRRP